MVSTLAEFNTRQVQHTPYEITASAVSYDTYQVVIHSIRHAVFVYEQSIPHSREIDSYDPISHHVLAWYQGRAVGTGRLAPNGRIGRVAVTQSLRRQGIGQCVMSKLMEIAQQQKHQTVFLAAQCHAIPFYEKLGFFQEGAIFNELGIQHVMMRSTLSHTNIR
ncbi:MAG: GNAT family N-acetyltransferase [Cyanobacteria bacterium P01_H01_bin.58]